MNRRLLEEVKTLVAEFWSEPREMLSAETSLGDDLGMDGDDAAEFMEAFSERFRVDLSGFDFERYFGPEAGPDPVSLIYGISRYLLTGRKSAMAQITLRDLAEAAERKRWP